MLTTSSSKTEAHEVGMSGSYTTPHGIKGVTINRQDTGASKVVQLKLSNTHSYFTNVRVCERAQVIAYLAGSL